MFGAARRAMQLRENATQVMALLNRIDESSVLACYCCDLEGEAIFTEAERCHCQLIWKAHRFLKQQREAA